MEGFTLESYKYYFYSFEPCFLASSPSIPTIIEISIAPWVIIAVYALVAKSNTIHRQELTSMMLLYIEGFFWKTATANVTAATADRISYHALYINTEEAIYAARKATNNQDLGSISFLLIRNITSVWIVPIIQTTLPEKPLNIAKLIAIAIFASI